MLETASRCVPREQGAPFSQRRREAANSRLKREALRRDNHGDLSRYCAGFPKSIPKVSQTGYVYCNQKYAGRFGFANTEAVTTTTFLDLIQPQDHALVQTLMAQSPSKEESLALGVLHHDGSAGDMMVTFTPVEFRQQSCMKVTARPLMSAIEATSKTISAAMGRRELVMMRNCRQFERGHPHRLKR